MKHYLSGGIMILGIIVCSLFAGQSNATTSECRGNLKMIVSGLESDKGQIKFDLDNAADTFKPKENGKKAFLNGHSLIKNKKVEYLFMDIPCGEYAIKLYHDANMNQTLDKNFLNIPNEKYGFSNCKGCIRPPKWEKAKFVFDKEHPEITIKL
jgi:uncharacterized protein (DUF2141 family)